MSMGVNDAEVKRIVLGTLPLTILSVSGVLLAVNGLWVIAVVLLVAAVGYFVWLQVWRRNREADEAIERAARHEAASASTPVVGDEEERRGPTS